MPLKYKKTKAPFVLFKVVPEANVLYKRGPRHFEVEQSAISLPLLETYDQHIRVEIMARRWNWQGEELRISSFARNFSF